MSTQDADHVVMVTCDIANFQLQIETPSLTLQPGQTVVWSITGLPEGWMPQISPDLGQVLPFESVTSVGTTIWGRGATTGSESVTYRVNLQLGSSVEIWGESGGALLFSPAATLSRAGQVRDAAETLTFTVTGEGTPKQLVVDPLSLTIHDGDTVIWNFEPSCFPSSANPSDFQLQVLFTHFTPDPGTTEPQPNLAFGPFEMLTTTNTTAERTVVGSGNNEIKGIYSFKIAVCDENSSEIHWTSTDDPSIDNRDGVDG